MAKKELLPLQMECMMLFQANPLMAVSVKELAVKLASREETVLSILNMLMKQGIIRQTGEEPPFLFQYQEPFTVIELGKREKLENP